MKLDNFIIRLQLIRNQIYSLFWAIKIARMNAKIINLENKIRKYDELP